MNTFELEVLNLVFAIIGYNEKCSNSFIGMHQTTRRADSS